MNPRNPAAIVSGVLILGDALAARLSLTADEARVYILGHPISWECAMRRAGLLCPTCGVTRSLVMTLDGRFAEAWRMAPGAPLLLLGILAAALAMLAAAALRRPLPRWLRATGAIYGALAASVWLGGWVVRFGHLLHPR
jgi:Protein of unknown function (DUF2752)